MNRRQDPKAINYLKNSQCGFERNLPKVCCLSPNLTKTISNPENCGTIDIMERIIGGDNAHQGTERYFKNFINLKLTIINSVIFFEFISFLR